MPKPLCHLANTGLFVAVLAHFVQGVRHEDVSEVQAPPEFALHQTPYCTPALTATNANHCAINRGESVFPGLRHGYGYLQSTSRSLPMSILYCYKIYAHSITKPAQIADTAIAFEKASETGKQRRADDETGTDREAQGGPDAHRLVDDATAVRAR